MNNLAPLKQFGALRLLEKSPDLDNLRIELVDIGIPRCGPGQVLVEIIAAAVNPSDVKASLGHMPHAVWPRIPGRDFAGIVREGPQSMIGAETWGSGGELGITQDGSHAKWMILNEGAVRRKPANLSMDEAGAVGVPFITAYEGFRDAGGVTSTDVVMVCGANGKVGHAALQMAKAAGARVFAIQRQGASNCGPQIEGIEILHIDEDVPTIIRERTNGYGADIVFNTVGSPYFEAANKSMAKDARQILISTLDRAVTFDIFPFFRGRHKFIGIDSLGMTSVECAKVLEKMRTKFEDGTFTPFPVIPAFTFGLDKAAAAYTSVLRGTPDRILLRP